MSAKKKKQEIQKPRDSARDKPRDSARDRQQGGAEESEMFQRNEQLHDEILKLTADIENFRRQVSEEISGASRRAVAHAIRTFAPALDAFRIALVNANASGKSDEWVEGMEKVYERFIQAFSELGVVPIAAEGEYDPKFHEAVERVPGEEYAVVEQVGVGWMWEKDKQVIVSAKVRVGSGKMGEEKE